MKRAPSLFLYALSGLLLVCVATAFRAGALETAGISSDPVKLWERLIRPLIRLTGFISVGLFVGQMIEAARWTDKMAVLARPFMRWGHLSDRMGAVFTTAFFSGAASLSMLASFHQEGLVRRREVTLSVLLNTFPSFFSHLPTTFFILLPLAGRAGVIYLLLTFGAAALRLGAVLAYTHFALPLPESQGHYHEKVSEDRDWKKLLQETGKKFKSRLINILVIVLPVYLVIVLISDMGFFLWLREFVARGITGIAVPVEAMSIVILSLAAELTSGYAAAGAMLDAGTLSVFQTVLALLIGNIIAAPIRMLRHQMPYYMGIFGPASGVRLMLINQTFRTASLIGICLGFILWVNMLG